MHWLNAVLLKFWEKKLKPGWRQNIFAFLCVFGHCASKGYK